MTSISGILQHDGSPVDPDIAASMQRALRHRGGNTVVRTMEHASLGGEVRGPINARWIVADARLDNRAELAAELGLAPNLVRALSDAALILRAHDQWGEQTPEHLLGDFAYALWDARQQAFFCARDHYGVRPFYYHAGAELFALASEPRALLHIDGVGDEIDDEQAASFLTGMDDSASATVYRGIRRLPAGHILTACDGWVRIRRYYALDPEKTTRFPNSASYGEAFLELFTRAVESRLGQSAGVACMLSGGLDSSSICGVARQTANKANRGTVSTISRIYKPESGCDERLYIDSMLELGGFDPHFIEAASAPALPELSRTIAEQGEPVFAPGLISNGELYSAARNRGFTGLLDGHGGDEVLSMGGRYLFELAQSDRWLRVALELVPFVATEGTRPFTAAAQLIANCGTSGRWRRRLALGNRWRKMRTFSDISTPLQGRPRWAEHLASDPRNTGLLERREAWRANHSETAATERLAHFRTLISPMQQTSFEVLDRTTAAAGAEGRYPFWDKKIVEFCVGLPSDQKLFAGWNRVVLRSAMMGILPERIRRRRDKTNFANNIHRSLARTAIADWEALIEKSGPEFARFIDLRWLRRCTSSLHSGSPLPLDTVFSLLRAAALGTWLGNRPAVRTRPMATPAIQISNHE